MFATWDDIDFVGKTYKVEVKEIDAEEFVPRNPEVRATPLTTAVCKMLETRKGRRRTGMACPSQPRMVGLRAISSISSKRLRNERV